MEEIEKIYCPLCSNSKHNFLEILHHIITMHHFNVDNFLENNLIDSIFICKFCKIQFNDYIQFTNHCINNHQKKILNFLKY